MKDDDGRVPEFSRRQINVTLNRFEEQTGSECIQSTSTAQAGMPRLASPDSGVWPRHNRVISWREAEAP